MKRYLFAAIAAGVASLAFVAGALAAPGTRVAFTVDEHFATNTGTILASSIPGCATATVTTPAPGGKAVGPMGLFWGTKVFDCGSSGTFTLDYRAHALAGELNDMGTWQITGGTGTYAGMTGQGLISGTYHDEFTVITDSYTGIIRLAE